jgi:hypothetical protein
MPEVFPRNLASTHLPILFLLIRSILLILSKKSVSQGPFHRADVELRV